MKIIILLLILFYFVNADIKLIKSKSCELHYLNISMVSKLFMLKKTFYENEKIIVIDNKNKFIYNTFVKKYLSKTPRKIKIYWTRMLFTGRKIPPKKLSNSELKNIKNKNICYLSYIDSKQNIQGWEELLITQD